MSHHATTAPTVERLIGRPLRPAERHVDVVRLDRALAEAKDELTRAIRAEQRRAARRALNSFRVELRVTNPMLDALRRLIRLGRDEAIRELDRAGYAPVRRAFAAPADEPPIGDPLWRHYHKLRSALGELSHKVDRELLALDLSTLATSSVLNALYSVAGGRDVASRMVSGALDTGLGLTFEANDDLVGGWEYTAILDGGTCGECQPLDGTTYDSWAAIQEVLPDGGPNPRCEGGDRCRCRPVPLPA